MPRLDLVRMQELIIDIMTQSVDGCARAHGFDRSDVIAVDRIRPSHSRVLLARPRA